MADQKELVTLNEFAEMTGIPINTVKYWRYIGQGPPFTRIGRRVMARRSDIEEWIEAQFKVEQ